MKILLLAILVLNLCGVSVIIKTLQQDAPTPVPDCLVVKSADTSHLECREGYKPATPAQKEAFCREQWRLFLKPYRQSGRPPTNASMEGCEDVSQPRFTDEELERP